MRLLIDANFRSDGRNREILPMPDAGFPYICKQTRMDNRCGAQTPWHWHHVFEINCVARGEVEFRTPQQTIRLRAGEAVFFNLDVMHTCRVLSDEGALMYTHLFDMHFLSGMYNSVFEEKYFQPVAKNKRLQSYAIRPDDYTHMRMMTLLLQAVQSARDEVDGYEFDIRAQLCAFWLLLLQETKELRGSATRQNAADVARIKVMMSFIHEHFERDLTLEQIAACAGVSGRECARCFERCIGVPPMRYLRDYRVRMAAQMLQEEKQSVMEIAQRCGFSSGSYFARVFREVMRCTPLAYKKASASRQMEE